MRACFRLESPNGDGDPFILRFVLQSPDDPSLLVLASEVWKARASSLEKLGRAFRDPQETLLEALGRASRLFPPVGLALETSRPEAIELDAAGALTFLEDGATTLAEAGFDALVPGELTAVGQRRLRLRMRVGGKAKTKGVVASASGLNLDELITVDWQAVIGDEPLSARELAALAKHKAPLVRFRGEWVAIHPHELGAIQARIAGGPGRMTTRQALQATLAGETLDGQLSVAVVASGSFAERLESFQQGHPAELRVPSTLRATLRPYQERGLHWLCSMASLGLGACLADDMGLGKTALICTLTREQASLYKAVVDEEMRRIEKAEAIERKGRVLALLTFTKQICNHPAQYLSESGPLPKRSGKLARLTEMLEEALAAGDKALVFTQFREMGEKLARHLAASLDGDVIFLHGGTPKRMRDEMVRRFQEEPRGPRVFVLSVKAGGTGLNLTAANHVFHFDRWWNPAVEDQATERAYRMGQKRAVQVHKLVCAGTVEEKIDQLLERKRELASKVVGTGEQWITELGTEELSELFALSESAVVSSEDSDNDVSLPLGNRERKPRASRREVRA